jgi:hypothetical protein
MAGQRHLLYVLALLQAGLTLMSTLGETIMMGGNLLYPLFGAAEAALFIVAGVSAAGGRRRWGLVTLIICDGLHLTGFGLSAAIGALPWVDLPLTGASLTDGLILPLVTVLLAAHLWSHARKAVTAAPDRDPDPDRDPGRDHAPKTLAKTLVEVGR